MRKRHIEKAGTFDRDYLSLGQAGQNMARIEERLATLIEHLVKDAPLPDGWEDGTLDKSGGASGPRCSRFGDELAVFYRKKGYTSIRLSRIGVPAELLAASF